ncbi:hypothetical protein KTH_12270 [Thermosporothrix hazakensis]|nr:hypothetical protein KTH_12270 [Thermosporothrix hazakensis]
MELTARFFYPHASLAQIGTYQIGAPDIDSSQISFCEARSRQIGTREVKPDTALSC